MVNYVQVLPYWTDYSLWVSTFVKKLCKHVLWLEKGKRLMYGDVDEVCAAYMEKY